MKKQFTFILLIVFVASSVFGQNIFRRPTYFFADANFTKAIAAATSFDPDAADGATLGTAALEFSDLFLADGGVIYFGADQDVVLTHVADAGLTLNGTLDPTVTLTGAGGDRGINIYMNKTTAALTGTMTGIRSNARINYESPSGTVMGGEFLAGNMDAGYSLSVARGVYAGLTNKVPSGAVTWGYARAFEANMDLDQGTSGNTNTITNAAMFYGVYNLPTVATYSTVTNGYGIFVRNEAVGGTGQMLDAAFYADDASMSGGISGWDYGIDFNSIGASGFGTADIRFNDGTVFVVGYDGTPNGALTAAKGSLCVDVTNADLYINTNGTTAWSALKN